MLDAFGLKKGMKEPDSLKSRTFLIISRRASMFSLCLASAKAMAAATAEVTVLKIECYIVGSITGRVVIFLKWKTVVGNLSASVSQKGL